MEVGADPENFHWGGVCRKSILGGPHIKRKILVGPYLKFYNNLVNKRGFLKFWEDYSPCQLPSGSTHGWSG